MTNDPEQLDTVKEIPEPDETELIDLDPSAETLADEDLSAEDEETLAGMTAEQEAEAQQFAVEFIKKVMHLRGVRITREDFLAQELRKIGLADETIAAAVATTPIQAGVTPRQLEMLARDVIGFETKKSAAFSFAAGLPGGLAMLATVPGDITQYYVHAFRIIQKLTYLYGWTELLGDLDKVDDETVGGLAMFLGVMLGVGGASASFGNFAKQVAAPAMQKQIAGKALTKTTWYPAMKQTLKYVGVKVTKDSLAKTVAKAVPVVSGAISGGMTLVALRSQSLRLQRRLRELPPPGVDAAQYLAAMNALIEEEQKPSAAREAIGGALSGAQAVAGSAAGAAGKAAAKGRARAGQMLTRAGQRLTRDTTATDVEGSGEKTT